MKPIDDFEFLLFDDESRYRTSSDDSGPEPIPERAPPHPRLRYRDPGFLGETFIFNSLLYRGRPIKHIDIAGHNLSAQFESSNGYLLFTTFRAGFTDGATVIITYLLKDFSGVQAGEIATREPQPIGTLMLDELLKRMPRVYPDRQQLPDPLVRAEVRDERRVDVFVRHVGGCQVTLYENPPRRFIVSSPIIFEPYNTTIFNKSYFSVKHLSPSHQSPVNWT